jgi:thiopurine S-methyltransferase
MDPSFWQERWREGRIGFHEGQPNTLLERYGQRLGGTRRVLVPLCGKSEDLAWLAAQGHQVVGVELVESAVRAFFAEHGLTPRESQVGGLRRFEAGAVTLVQGDFFACTAAELGACDAFYDRAALIALPPELRARYVRHLRGLLQPGAPGLVITLEYAQERMEGPPFSVLEAELRALYQGAHVALLAERPAQAPRIAELGLEAHERCFSVDV